MSQFLNIRLYSNFLNWFTIIAFLLVFVGNFIKTISYLVREKRIF